MSQPPTASSPTTIGRYTVPAFITDLWEEKAAFQVLVAACAAIAAVGLDPHILDPGMPTVRATIREDSGIRSLLMLGAVVQAGLLLLGGLVADRLRSERLLRLALGGLVVTSILAILVPDGLGILVVRLLAWTCDGVVLPFAIGAVAMSYSGAARGTALGVIYGVYGAATAVAPALILKNGPTGSPSTAFAVCAIVAAIAIIVCRRMPDLPGAPRSHWHAIRAVALFAFGVVAVVAALIQVGGGLDAIRIGTIIVGLTCIGLSLLPERKRRDGLQSMGIDLRPVAIALAVGVVVGFAQAAPMLQLPQFFTVIQGSSPIVATIAIAPFVIALLLAGPASGYLLARIGPRTLIASGAIALGVADLVIFLVLDRSTAYPFFILPFLLIGAGFVIATTVRTAIIFASVPRGLPASAAALNEASIGMGSRVGVVVAVVVMTQSAIDSYAHTVASQPAGLAELHVNQLRTILEQFSLHPVSELTAGLDPSLVSAFGDAVVDGMQMANLVPGVVAILTGILAFIAMGPRDPVRSVWDMADEREEASRSAAVQVPSNT